MPRHSRILHFSNKSRAVRRDWWRNGKASGFAMAC